MSKKDRVLIDVMYREMFRQLWIWARRQLEDDGLAEEAVQETFRIACEKETQVMSSENPRGWIMKTLKFTVMSIKRERAQLGRLYIRLETEEKTAELSDENVDLMYSDLINEEDFEMLKMIVLEKCTLKDAAQAYGITVSACKKRLQRIKMRLQHIIEDDENGGERFE